MIRALLSGQKTQTRRLMGVGHFVQEGQMIQSTYHKGFTPSLACPFVKQRARDVPPESRILELQAYYASVGAIGRNVQTRIKGNPIERLGPGDSVKVYSCLRAAAQDIGCSVTTIHVACERGREYGGFRWRKI